jgi:hypothetical protein
MKKLINWLSGLFKKPPTDLIEFYWEGNKVLSNVPIQTMRKLLRGKSPYVKSIEATYNDGHTKRLTFYEWKVFGSGILTNCKNIKVRVIYANDPTKGE